MQVVRQVPQRLWRVTESVHEQEAVTSVGREVDRCTHQRRYHPGQALGARRPSPARAWSTRATDDDHGAANQQEHNRDRSNRLSAGDRHVGQYVATVGSTSALHRSIPPDRFHTRSKPCSTRNSAAVLLRNPWWQYKTMSRSATGFPPPPYRTDRAESTGAVNAGDSPLVGSRTSMRSIGSPRRSRSARSRGVISWTLRS